MATITLHGPPPSSYVRTARMTCAEKGVDHQLVPVEFGSDAHRALHPFAKVPILEHDGLRLYETAAIIRYIDAAFEGPSLVPEAAADLGAMEQWTSALNCYLYDHLVVRYALQYFFPKGPQGQPDRAVIDAAIPEVERDLDLLERALEGRDWLAGRFSLADLMVAPVIATAASLPEAGQVIDRSPNIRRWLTAIERRPCGPLLRPPAS